MKREPEKLEEKSFDLIVIGGGIHGAGIARDAALRGLSVALIEKGDFGSGSSSRSSKMIHGGLPHLEHFRFGSVREALHERSILLRIAPQVTRLVRFITPIYKEDPRGPFRIRTMLRLYDYLAGDPSIQPHRYLSPAEIMEIQPSIERNGLLGAGVYMDAVVDDARLCFLNVLDAYRAGAVCVNYVEAKEFLWSGGAISGVRAMEVKDMREVDILGKVVVNATGPWADLTCRLDSTEKDRTYVRLTRGVHIVVPLCLSGDALSISARKDGRAFFVIPWGNVSIVGTTDNDFRGHPDTVPVEQEEIDYLLNETARVLPRARLDRSSVLYAYAGLRPFVKSDRFMPRREHRIVEHKSGLISVIGGRYTTYRAVAEQVVDLVIRRNNISAARPCQTATRVLPGAEIDDMALFIQDRKTTWRERLPGSERHVEFLVRRYGVDSETILELALQDPRLLQPIAGGLPNILAEIVYSHLHEMGITMEDVLRRRLGISLMGISQDAVERRIQTVV